MINSIHADDPARKRLLDIEERVIRLLSSQSSWQNTAGTYIISCSYSSEKGPWFGTVRAKPRILKIVFEKNLLDQEFFGLNSNKK